jgi:hypothetical protein
VFHKKEADLMFAAINFKEFFTLTELVYFIGSILSGVVVLLLIYMFSGKRIDKNRFIISSIILGICTYIVRLLPIHFGIHTLIILMLIVLISVVFLKIEIFKAIVAGILIMILMYICDILTVVTLTYVFKVSQNALLSRCLNTALIGLPPTIFTFVFGYILIYFLKKIKRVKKEERE